MPRKPPTQKELTLPQLEVARSKAEELLQVQIKKGREIRGKGYRTPSDLKAGKRDKESWYKFTVEVLQRIFSTEQYTNEFRLAHTKAQFYLYQTQLTLQETVLHFEDTLNVEIRELESIQERLVLIPEPETDSISKKEQEERRPATPTRDVFVVHGHDEAAKQSVARFLEKLDLKPIILHEKPNQGRTIIEKFENYSDVGFAVILFTPDDVGAAKGEEGGLKPRARQNVVFELGFFIGKMGRGRVCVLHKDSVEILTDYEGVLYEPMDQSEAWQMKLAKELRAAGIEIDFNKL
jgi:predicted nucleotide-binding protein